MATEVYQCSRCSKAFPTLGRYNQHLKTHSKPYICDQCKEGFALRSDLNRHTSTRHRVGQKIFPCNFGGCTSKFKRKDNLLQHISDFHGTQTGATGANAQSASHSETLLRETQEPNITFEEQDMALACQVSPTTVLQAASTGNTGLLEWASSSGIDLFMMGDDGSTALHCAARAGQASAVKLLLDLGCPLEAKNSWGRTPLHEALLGQDLETLAALVQRCPDVHVDDKYRKTAMEYALESANTELPRLLLKHMSVEQINGGAKPALYLATKFGRSDMVQELVTNPAVDMNQKSASGHSPLHIAAKYGHEKVVQQLISRNETRRNISKGLYMGKTPLHYAAQYGHEGVVKLLLALDGLALSAVASETFTAVDLAILNEYPSLAQMLLQDHRYDVSTSRAPSARHGALAKAVTMNYVAVTKLLLKDSRLNLMYQSRSSVREPVLHFATRHNNVEMMDILLQKEECLVNSRSYGTYDLTPLHICATDGHIEAAKLLLQHKEIQPNIRNTEGNTPLHYASLNDHIEIARLLLQHKEINPNLQNWEGNTPLHCALLNDHVEIARLLLAHQCLDINNGESWNTLWSTSKDTPDETVFEIARRKGQLEIIELLVSRGDISAQGAIAAIPYLWSTTTPTSLFSSPSAESAYALLEWEQEKDWEPQTEESAKPNLYGN